ncbi:glycine betaine ABC transporter substrate-binding protein [Streptomyces noursei]|uniref:Glycine/betaine ABC transporter substrate-binding protein n=1 Tax=Streptomyces noursei TaxID=1971 RepID=A0A059W7Y4_STRNR|nr:glycine betaine ABC transporter substrate-binding protein [Streptomyces noursei]AIA03871.1 ABC transporter substrate-binding protein [Streptomyces noursei]EXU88308.1 glycine/betaine ABC transporter substrate-binding protein [Streptomyces noursei PD-1]UWS72518.1 glycine betaine ABC transporter substrate-binding protein [Streptomyces noursei]GCB91452.1 glycine/betaine ABC transporter substrate-binding protein [Streptomyces noursei]
MRGWQGSPGRREHRGARRAVVAAVLAAALLGGCGLVSGSPMTDDVAPGTVGKGLPLKGAELTVTSKEFTENIILGQIMGLVFKAAGATVIDKTNIQGTIGAREAVRTGTADGMYEYTGTGWITHLGHVKPIPDPQRQWEAVRDADLRNGIVWLPQSRLNNTYALALNTANEKKYQVRTLSDVAALLKKDPGAVTLCVENEFATRNDGLPGMAKAYGMNVPPGNVRRMTGGVVYTETAKGTSCTFGEVFTTDGRIKAMGLTVLADDKHFFPNYNAAPEINAAALRAHPQIAAVLAPVTAALNNEVAQKLNAKVDVEGQDPHAVAKEWLLKEGFIKEGGR